MTILRDPVESQLRAFGLRLRELRARRGWTLEDLGHRSGLSAAFLSRLESSDRQASVAAVLTLARVFGVSLASMFETSIAQEPCLIVRADEAKSKELNGLTYAPLSDSDRFFNVQPLRVTVSVAREGDEHFRHEGSEWIHLLSGQLTLSLAGTLYQLEPGDSAHFDSRLPHRLIARGRRDAELLLVASPFSEAAAFAQSRDTRGHRAVSLADRMNSS